MKNNFLSKYIGFLMLLWVVSERVYSQETQWSSEYVYYGSGGRLSYTADEKGNIIPDFSHVGYKYGDESIPQVPVVIEISPVDGDDGDNIQAAIDFAEALTPDENGFRGAVLLKKGTYQVNGQLTIQSGGVVLRGEGQGENGTIIIAEGTETRPLINIGNGSGMVVNQSSKVDIIEDYVPIGRKFVVVEDASDFSAGDHIALYRPGTQKWITDLKMDQIPNPDGETQQWIPSSYSFYFERDLTRVSGDTLFFRNPVVMAMEEKYGGGSVLKVSFNRLQKAGVEDLCLKSAFTSETDENHSWIAVEFNSAENSWARRVTSWYFAYSCVSLERNSRLISVIDCHSREPKSIITGGRRYSFNLVGQLNLFKDCTTTEGRHDYVSSSRVCGPNVFTRCSASSALSDIGPHHRWAMGTLFDVIETDGEINVQDRGDMGTGHGWAGANQVFWNCVASSSVCQSPWVSARNYNIGFRGQKNSGAFPDRPDGEWEGHNRSGLVPESLYEAQLATRKEETQVFSVYSQLNSVSDSGFVLSFNMEPDPSSILSGNFNIGGDAGYEGKEFSIQIFNDTSLLFEFDAIGILRAFSTVIIEVENVISIDGKELEGIRFATYIEPDKRPVVNGLALTVNNEDGFLVASSSKPGKIYLVKYSGTYTEVTLLDASVSNNTGRKVDAPNPGTSVPVYTRGLPGGLYNYYAVDEEGRVSEPADEWPMIEETGPVTGLNGPDIHRGFSLLTDKGTLLICPDEGLGSYGLQVFDHVGRLVYSENGIYGNHQTHLPESGMIFIIRIISHTGVSTRKIIVTR